MDYKMKKGFFYLAMALLAFAGIGLEVILAFGLEPVLYGAELKDWTVSQNIIHWILTCILWGASAFGVITLAKKKGDFDIFQKGEKVELWKWIVIILIIIGSLVISYIDWKGFKVVKEFRANGSLKFVFQYIYYIFEVLLVTLILVFSQKAFEEWFKNPYIPYGGIIVALTWGIGHFFTKDFMTGIITMLSGLAFGSVYLLVNRDIKKAYIILWLIFVL